MGRSERRHIAYISGTRADYGLMRETLAAIHAHPRLRLSVIATGMHLMPAFGNTSYEIRRDPFTLHTVQAVFAQDTERAMAAFFGQAATGLVPLLARLKPDILLLLGDRAEMLAAASVALYLGIPVAHVHGGDVSYTVDETARHAVTKLAHIHFAATRSSAARIIKMGENRRHVFVTGAPGIDALKKVRVTRREICARYGLDPDRPFVLVVQHPVTGETDRAPAQYRATLDAVRAAGLSAVVVYPNADAGGRAMIRTLRVYRHGGLFSIHKNLPHDDYLALLKHCAALLGNSSSGIIEAASFKTPVVNIGTRQGSRECGRNVVHCGYGKKEIAAALDRVLYDTRWRGRLRHLKNPYGSGRAGMEIAEKLAAISLDGSLRYKTLTY